MINPDEVEFLELNNGWKALVDADIYPELSKYKWTILKTTSRVYAQRKVGSYKNRKQIWLHHAVLPRKKGLQADHIQANTPFCVLDERRSNLRYATNAQQQQNRRNKRHGRFKGVRKSGRGWSGRIANNGHNIYLGMFVSEKDAARAYDESALRLFGKFALLNFPNRKDADGLQK